MRFPWVLIALAALGGCHKGDGLVVVTVNASEQLANIAALKATAAIAGGAPTSFTVPTGAPFDLPPPKTFGIDVPSSFTGTFALHLEADDASGAELARGDGMVDLSPGGRVDLSIVLGPQAPADAGMDAGVPDGGMDAGGDAAADAAPDCDGGTLVTGCGPSCQVCPVPSNGIATCNGTACDIQCNSGFHACNGACVSNNDVTNCGPSSCTACPVPTGGTATCDGTQCGGSCPSGMKLCAGACIDMSMACSGMCPTGTHDCSGLCDSDSSVNSCGTSCTSCPSILNAMSTCDGTKCGYACDTGTHDCGNGQCLSNTSLLSCGTSCSPCPSPPTNGTETCDGTKCGVACNTGYHLCGATCADNTSLSTCGTSCSPCPAPPTNGTETCDGTQCGFTCSSGYVAQGTSCVACGALGQPCCAASSCSPGLACSATSNSCGSPWRLLMDNSSTSFVDVWGSGPQDVFVLGPSFSLYHSTDGSTFTGGQVSQNFTRAIWGNSSVDIYVAGSVTDSLTGTVYPFLEYSDNDSASWVFVSPKPNIAGSTSAIWGSGASDVYAVGQDGSNAGIFHSSGGGSAFSAVSVPASTDSLTGVWGSGASDVYAVGGSTVFHFNGSSWSSQAIPSGSTGIYCVWGSGALDVYAGGNNGILLHTTDHGSTWTRVSLPPSLSTFQITRIWGSGNSDLYLVGSGAAHFDGTSWVVQTLPTSAGTGVSLDSVWGTGSSNVYAVGLNSNGHGLILHYP